jgi:hypothetical protein
VAHVFTNMERANGLPPTSKSIRIMPMSRDVFRKGR